MDLACDDGYVIRTAEPPRITLERLGDGAHAEVRASATALALVAAHLDEASVPALCGRTFRGAADDFQAAFTALVGRARRSSIAPLERVTLILPAPGWIVFRTWSEYLGTERLRRFLDEALVDAPTGGGVSRLTPGGLLVCAFGDGSPTRDIDVRDRDRTTIRLGVRFVALGAFWLDRISGSWPDPGGRGFITR